MDAINTFISEKGFNPVSFGLSMLWGILVVGLSSGVAVMESNEHKSFHCQIKGDDKDYIQGLCFNNYQTETTKGFPIYGFVSLVFILNIAVCIIYYQCVKSRIKTELDEVDVERQETNHSFGLICRCYCIQLVTRFFVTTTFVIVQWTILYPVSFPSTYSCVNTSDTNRNATRATYQCNSKQTGNKTYVSICLFSINVLFAIFILSELIYVFRKIHREINFKRDSEFFIVYLLNDNTNINDYQNNMKNTILIKTKYYEPIFPNIAGEERKLLELNTIFTSLIVYPGREKCDFHGERHEIIEGYIKRKENYSLVNEVRDIFKANEESEVRPSNIMIIGRPGIGKSLLCQKICREMASNGMNQELSFDFVYLFEFRRFKSDERLNLRKLLGKCQFSKCFTEAVFRNIRYHPEKVLIIFDGLDEIGRIKENFINEEEQSVENSLSEEMSVAALFGKLIKGTFLKGATIVTTSRPTALSSVANVEFNKTLEILGFTEEEIKQYVKRFFQDDEMKLKMWDHISSNSNLLSLCYIPAICHIVCFSLQQILESDDDLPLTLTEIYTKAIKYIVKKHNRNYENDACEQEMEPVSSTSIHSFTTMMKAVVTDLGKLAYDGLESGRFIFESSEVTRHKESGLLHQLPGQRLTDEEAQFCFIHLTMQEFVAATHIVQTTKEDLESLRTWISEHIREGKWQLVIQFIAGRLHEENGETRYLRIFTDLMQSDVSHSNESRWPSQKDMALVLILFQCIFENKAMLKNNDWNHMITDNFEGVKAVNLSKSGITDADTGAIVYVLQHFHNMHSLDVSCNLIGCLGYLKIFELLRMDNLRTLFITQNQAMSEETAKHLSEALSSHECRLTKLFMGANAIGDVGLQHLSFAISKEESKLTTLVISGNEIGDDGVKHLSDALSSNNCKLTTLDISGNEIGDDGVQYLSDALSSRKCQITTLDISGNKIGDDGVQYLSDALSSRKCQITTLDISGNKIGDDGVQYLSDALSSRKCQITTLDISGNKIGDDGVKHLSDALSSKKGQITTLDISGNKIGDDGVKHLSDALSSKKCQITTLDISDNKIADDGVKHLSDALTSKKGQITTLDISGNKIGDDGLKHLSDALTIKECQLTTLDISHNNIGDDGIRYFSDVLTSSNFKITTLYFLGNAISGSGLQYFHFKNLESKGKISRSKFS